MVVDLGALMANYRFLAERVAPAECAAVVKADAYGMGVARVAPALERAGCRSFFVATAEESIQLRELLPAAHIYVLESLNRKAMARAVRSDIRPVLNSYEEVLAWQSVAEGKPDAFCGIHIDTGMSRLGMDESDVSRLTSCIGDIGALNICYVMTHLACADDVNHEQNSEQLREFNRLRGLLGSFETSIGNSAGIFLGEPFHGDLARAGIAIFGCNPMSNPPNPMREVARVEGRILQIRPTLEPSSVGYGATAHVGPGSRLATVAFGYADGYPRSLGNKAHAIVSNRPVPVIGRVSMDSLVLDITKVPQEDVSVGDWATLIGGGVDWDELADAAGTISYELMTRIGPRVDRKYAE